MPLALAEGKLLASSEACCKSGDDCVFKVELEATAAHFCSRPQPPALACEESPECNQFLQLRAPPLQLSLRHFMQM